MTQTAEKKRKNTRTEQETKPTPQKQQKENEQTAGQKETSMMKNKETDKRNIAQ